MTPTSGDNSVDSCVRRHGQRPELSARNTGKLPSTGTRGHYRADNPPLLNTGDSLPCVATAGNQRVIKAIPSPYDDYYLNESLTYITTGEAA